MKALLIKNHIESFKNIKEKDITFSDRTTISGKNGVGKTTQSDAFSWLLSNTDSRMKSNPLVKPLDMEEAVSLVEANFEIDDKPVQLAKSQKTTVSKPDINGIVKTSTTNTYQVNGVPKGERDFKLYLENIGIDANLIVPLTQIDGFTSKKPDDRRALLFEMAKSFTDKEIADQMDAKELSNQLDLYTIEEIKAMNKSEIRKINENYGKEGEIIRAKIEGVEKMIIEPDETVDEQVKALLEDLEAENEKLSQIKALETKREELKDNVLQLEFRKNEILREAEEKRRETTAELKNRVFELGLLIKDIDRQIQMKESELVRTKDNIEWLGNEWKSIKSEQMKTKSLVCPTCDRPYEEGVKAKIIARFEADKKSRLEKTETSGKEECKIRDELIEKINSLQSEKDKIGADFTEAKATYDSAESSFVYTSKDLDEIRKKIGGCNSSLTQIETSLRELEPNGVAGRINTLNQKISDLKRKNADAIQNNERVAKQIASLREEQRNFEKNKANAEKMLFLIDEFEKKKNQLLADSINSNFKKVKFKLWETYKNGEYKPCCVPMYDGKDLGISTNTGLEIMMKLDIINGLQNFFNMHLPVFVDNAECLSLDTMKQIDMDTQIIFLKVTEDKELTVTNE